MTTGTLFSDRADAGRILAGKLERYARQPGVIVLGLPLGGVPVAAEVARNLGVPLDILVVCKLGMPGQAEFAIGAVAPGGVRVLHEGVADRVPDDVIEALTSREIREMIRREQTCRGSRPALELGGRTVILVDDGIATGVCMEAAVRSVRRHHPARLVVAVPVAPVAVGASDLGGPDELEIVAAPEGFLGVSQWYEDFSQTSDGEVIHLLDTDATRMSGARGGLP